MKALPYYIATLLALTVIPGRSQTPAFTPGAHVGFAGDTSQLLSSAPVSITELTTTFSVIALTISPKGAFTISATFGNEKFSGKGTVGAEGQISAALTTRKRPETLDINLANSGNGTLVGTIGSSGWSRTYTAIVNASSYSKKDPYDAPTKFTMWSQIDYEGLYAAHGLPFGTSAFVGQISESGAVKIAGRTANGDTVTISTILWKVAGNKPVFSFCPPKQGAWGFTGWMRPSTSETVDWEGRIAWKPKEFGQIYQAPAFASRYTPPPKGALPLDWTGGGNATVEALQVMTSGMTRQILSTPMSVSGTFNPKGAFVATTSNDIDLKLAVAPSTGKISGSFVAPGTSEKVPIYGVVNGKTSEGSGFFWKRLRTTSDIGKAATGRLVME